MCGPEVIVNLRYHPKRLHFFSKLLHVINKLHNIIGGLLQGRFSGGNCQRWSSEGPKRGVLKMWMEYACRSLHFSRSAPNDSPRHQRLATPERKKCKLRHARLIACGVNPTFQCQSATSHHLLHQFWKFLHQCVLLINKYHCNKNGVKQPSSLSDTPFGPISLPFP